MRFFEAKLLNEVINNLDINLRDTKKSPYTILKKINFPSLQQSSLTRDKEYFAELKFIISVINTIIAKPHILSKEEQVIIRSEQAKSLNSDSFNLTIKDPSLWKENSERLMQPEYVHNVLYTDKIDIYENMFICLLIDLINSELISYRTHYLKLVSTLDNSDLIVNKDYVIEAIELTDSLLRKLRYIKNSSFYKTVSKTQFNEVFIKPTNILLKDRLYNYCYKFYKKMIVYEDLNALIVDFNYYLTNLIIKALFNLGYKRISNMSFTNGIFSLEFKITNTKYIDIFVESNKYKKPYRHRLIIDTAEELNNYEDSDILTYSLFDIWNIYDIKKDSCLSSSVIPEIKLIENYLNKLTHIIKVDSNIYKKYCLVCRNSIDDYNNTYVCEKCGSIYTYLDDNTIWLIK